MAEMVGFEPTDPVRDQRISSAPRYDHFDTSPCIKIKLQSHITERHPFRQPERYGAFLERYLIRTVSQQSRKVLILLHLVLEAIKLTITFRVRPVMTTSIRLRARPIVND